MDINDENEQEECIDAGDKAAQDINSSINDKDFISSLYPALEECLNSLKEVEQTQKQIFDAIPSADESFQNLPEVKEFNDLMSTIPMHTSRIAVLQTKMTNVAEKAVNLRERVAMLAAKRKEERELIRAKELKLRAKPAAELVSGGQ